MFKTYSQLLETIFSGGLLRANRCLVSFLILCGAQEQSLNALSVFFGSTKSN